LRRDVKITITSGIAFIILSRIVAYLWDQITPVLFLQSIPTNPQAYFGIIIFAGAITSGIIFILFLLRITKKKRIDAPASGLLYQQIGCPKCHHPNIVYAPTKDYTRVVYSECKEKGALEENHNRKDECKCYGCGKKFDFYWCRGHPIIRSGG
jgi:phage FluMu protein Com